MISSEVIIELVILILLIALSAWFSSAETAYSTVSEVSLRARADEKDRRAARALEVLDQYSKMLSTILICNNIVNLSASALCTSLIIRLFGATLVGIGTAALTVVVILFGEITPKNIAKIRSEETAKKDAAVMLANDSDKPITLACDFQGRSVSSCRITDNDRTDVSIPFPSELPPRSFLVAIIQQ